MKLYEGGWSKEKKIRLLFMRSFDFDFKKNNLKEVL